MRRAGSSSSNWIVIVPLNWEINREVHAQNCKYFLQLLAIESKNAP
jgi:hypothetical protein